MDPVCSFEAPVRIYQTTLCHNAEDQIRIVAAANISSHGLIYTKVFLLQTAGDLKPFRILFEIRLSVRRTHEQFM
jgi:hypothetical protein